MLKAEIAEHSVVIRLIRLIRVPITEKEGHKLLEFNKIATGFMLKPFHYSTANFPCPAVTPFTLIL